MSESEIGISIDGGLTSSSAYSPPIPNKETSEVSTIRRVPSRLVQDNDELYKPKVISIGPYHHGNGDLKEMECIKRNFFNRFVGESKENAEKLNDPETAEKVTPADCSQKEKAIKRIKEAIGNMEVNIRGSYGERWDMISSNDFVDMVVLDGFFIVQLFRGFYPIEDLFRRQYIQTEIMYDLLLLENQLPFFVLVELYGIVTQVEKTVHQDEMTEQFTKIAIRFYDPLIGYERDLYEILLDMWGANTEFEVEHLLSLIYDTKTWILVYGPNETIGRLSKKDVDRSHQKGKTKQNRRRNVPEDRNKPIWNPYLKSIRCATELENAGIRFETRVAEKEECLDLQIEYKRHRRKPKLRIPTLIVGDNTERMLRNLIAFEQLLPPSRPTYLFDYVKFLDLLINSGKDVQLLCYSGIIENMLGRDYEAVAQIFNRLCDNAHGSANFYYSDIFEKVDRHCHSRWSQQIAYLQRNYFNSAWALLSFLGALLLLFLTLAQTIFSLLSADCVSCSLVFIVLAVLLLVVVLFCCLLFGFR